MSIRLTDPTRARLDERKPDPEHRRLIGISLLPSAATLGNLLCGLVAILLCLLAIRAPFVEAARPLHPHVAQFFPSFLTGGAYLIILAMIFDALDGRLARLARKTSGFGAQLDSLADLVSFGAAPTLLYLTLLLRPTEGGGPAEAVSKLEWRIGLLCALVYVSCAAIRLARYNVENVHDESARQRFAGLPTPGAAAALVSLMALHQDLLYSGGLVWGVDWVAVIRWIIAPSTLALGLLMVSRIAYPHVFNVFLKRKHPPAALLVVVVFVALLVYSPPILLALVAFVNVLGGPILLLVRRPLPRPEPARQQPTRPSSTAGMS